MSRISNYFLTEGLYHEGISYKVTNGKLSIKIDSNVSKIQPNFYESEGSEFFNIGNDSFWIVSSIENAVENTVEYTVSHIVQHGPDVEFNDSTSKKVSDAFLDISYTESITVILK
jgi:hypothetical protein